MVDNHFQSEDSEDFQNCYPNNTRAGEEILFRKWIIVIAVLFIPFSINTSVFHASNKENLIERKILTGMDWIETTKGTQINLNYITVQKLDDQSTVYFETTRFISGENLEYKDLTKDKVESYIKENGSYGYVYEDDQVYGHYLKIFADIRDKYLSKEEIDKLIKEAKEEVDHFYSKKADIISGKMEFDKNIMVNNGKSQTPFYEVLGFSVIGVFLGVCLLYYVKRVKK